MTACRRLGESRAPAFWTRHVVTTVTALQNSLWGVKPGFRIGVSASNGVGCGTSRQDVLTPLFQWHARRRLRSVDLVSMRRHGTSVETGHPLFGAGEIKCSGKSMCSTTVEVGKSMSHPFSMLTLSFWRQLFEP